VSLLLVPDAAGLLATTHTTVTGTVRGTTAITPSITEV